MHTQACIHDSIHTEQTRPRKKRSNAMKCSKKYASITIYIWSLWIGKYLFQYCLYIQDVQLCVHTQKVSHHPIFTQQYSLHRDYVTYTLFPCYHSSDTPAPTTKTGYASLFTRQSLDWVCPKSLGMFCVVPLKSAFFATFRVFGPPFSAKKDNIFNRTFLFKLKLLLLSQL